MFEPLTMAEYQLYFWWSWGPVLIVLLTVMLRERGLPSWGARKFSHILGNTLAAVYMILSQNFWAVFYILVMSLLIGFTLSLTPVRLLQRSTEGTMREGEHKWLMVANIAVTTSTSILYYGYLSLLGWDYPIVVICGIFSMSIGDGLGEVVGRPFGRYKFRIFSEKSVEGSLAVFLGSFISFVTGALFTYRISVNVVLILLLLAFVTMVIEMSSWLFLDNVILPFAVGSLAYLLLY